MLKVRTSKTSSGSTSVQIIFNTTNKVNIIKHIGSGKTDQEIEDLKARPIYHRKQDMILSHILKVKYISLI